MDEESGAAANGLCGSCPLREEQTQVVFNQMFCPEETLGTSRKTMTHRFMCLKVHQSWLASVRGC